MTAIAALRYLLQTEIVRVTGCTEPASVAFAFLMARRHLKGAFDPRTVQARLTASAEVLRNASTAVVPFLGRRGLPVVVAAGLSSSAKDFNLFPHINRRVAQTLLTRKNWLDHRAIRRKGVYVKARLSTPDEVVEVVLAGRHNEITHIHRDGKEVFRAASRPPLPMSLPVIYQWAQKRQPALEAIARDFILRQVRGPASLPLPERVARLVRERMCGSSAAVMTLTGSGNQGIFIGVPFYELYRERGDAVLPAVLFALLTQIHLSSRRRRISGDCGLAAKSAPALAAGLAFAQGANLRQIRQLMKNVECELQHLRCPGALPSCGGKARLALAVVLRQLETMTAKKNGRA